MAASRNGARKKEVVRMIRPDDDLLNCPFCGYAGHATYIKHEKPSALSDVWKGKWVVGCLDRECHGYIGNLTKYYSTRDHAKESWNRRATENGRRN